MKVVELTAHPGNADPVPDRVLVTVGWTAATRRLALQYHLRGAAGRILLPAPAPAGRADGLWRHSCCEAFVGHAGAADYCEFNFSPSGEWAAYRFTARRLGMRPLEGIEPPTIRLARAAGEVVIEARLDLGPVAPGQAAELVLGLAAIVDDREGRQSFWALRHGSSRPDFHDPKSFSLHLDTGGTLPPQEPAP
jgi:hypothetical protein